MFSSVFSLFLLFVVPVASKVTVVSDPTLGLVAALAASSDGDTVQVRAGIYSGSKNCNLLVTQSGLSLVGVDGASATILDCGDSRCVTVLGSGFTMSGFTLRNGLAPNTAKTALRQTAELHKMEQPRPLPRRAVAQTAASRSLAVTIRVFVTTSGTIESQIISATSGRPPPRPRPRPTRSQLSATGRVASRATTPAPSTQSVGGCVLVSGAAQTTLQDVVVTGCRAEQGAGLAVVNSVGVRVVRVEARLNGLGNSTSKSGLAGGGAYFSNVTGVRIESSVFRGNFFWSAGTGTLSGAGLCLSQCQGVEMVGDGLEVSGNSLTGTSSSQIAGGGVYVGQCVGVVFAARNVSIVGNSLIGGAGVARVTGGGVALYNCMGTALTAIGPISISLNSAVSSVFAAGGGLFVSVCPGILLSSTGSGSVAVSSNSVKGVSAGKHYGGGLHVENSIDVTVTGKVSVTNNSIVSVSIGGINGGGAYMYNVTNGTMDGALISDNIAILIGGGNVIGGGMLISRGLNFTLSRSEFSFNFVQLDNSRSVSSSALSVYSADDCPASLQIYANSGILRNNKDYQISLNCLWSISSASATDAATLVYEIQFQKLDVEASGSTCVDFITIYDGPSSLSPSLGRICGRYPGNLICTSSTACSANQSTVTSTGSEITILFNSNGQVTGAGFDLMWNMVPQNPHVGLSKGVPARSSNIFSLPCAYGGGLALIASKISIQSCHFANNVVESVLMGSGGGVFLGSDSQFDLRDSKVINNTVIAAVTAGGGLASNINTFLSQHSIFMRNRVVASGDCFYADKLLQCPSSFGGGVFVQGSAVFASSEISHNTASCASRYPCIAHGGGVAITNALAALTLSNSSCSHNTVACEAAGSCVSGLGGCLHGDLGRVVVDELSSIDSNTVSGGGGGGGVYSAGSLAVSMSSASVTNNTAREGGGLLATGGSAMRLRNSSVSRNIGLSIGGGIALTGSASLDVQSCEVVNNSASRATAILAFNDDSSASYRLRDTRIEAGEGSSALMLGGVAMEASVMWRCSQPGSVYQQDVTAEFYSLQCVACDSGTYTLDRASTLLPGRACLPCPAGGICGGSKGRSSSGFRAQPGFWGTVDDQASGRVSFHLCPSGYCCAESEAGGCEHDHCEGGRVGVLCGQCPQGSGLRFLSERCGLDSECRDAVWAAPVIVAGAVGIAVFLVATATSQSTSMSKSVQLYFYQVLSLVKSTPWRQTSQTAIFALQSVSNLAPSGDSGSSGICLIESLTASRRLGAQILLRGVVLGAFGVVYVGHQIVWRTALRQRESQQERAPSVAVYGGAVVRFLMIAYTTLSVVSLQMLQCVEIAGRRVWWLDGSIECYERFQIVAIGAVCVLSVTPLGVGGLMWRWREEAGLGAYARAIRHVLTKGYRDDRRWYLGVSLLRRLALAISFSQVADLNTRALVISVVCTAALCVHLVLQPYRNAQNNKMETLTLGILCFLAYSSAASLAKIEYATTAEIGGEARLEWVQFVLSVAPAVFFLIEKLFSLWTKALAFTNSKLQVVESRARVGSTSLNPVILSRSERNDTFCDSAVVEATEPKEAMGAPQRADDYGFIDSPSLLRLKPGEYEWC